MWIVRLALRRPYTVAVMCLLILVMGILSVSRMVVDIFPAIDIPVVAVIWNYPGLPAQDMERRVVLISERAYSTTVNGIERIESQSIPGIGMLKIYFQPGADIGAAIAQITSVSTTILRITPPGMQPPNVIQFNASNVPVAQLTASSETMPEEKIFDYGLNFIRVRLFTIPGLSCPAPYGGKQRQINVDIDTRALAARGLTPTDVVNALQASNVILPAGDARIGDRQYNVLLNSSPPSVEDFATIPVKAVNGAMVLLGDVAHVVDAYADQFNVVRVGGKRATYLAILKHADASTLAVVDAVRDILPAIKASAPEGLELKIDFDQSVFVRGAIGGVVREAVISSILVSLMVGAFLGSWRSMVIVCTSIPLAIFSAVVGLKLTGNTINIMTLGGLALAIGMLVDDATVEVENIHRNRSLGKPLTRAILDGAQQIAVPAIVATLAICIVFFPVVLLFGPARFLFTSLALSVVLAMLASYLLSRTLVPSLARLLMAGEHHAGAPDREARSLPRRVSSWSRLARRFNARRDLAFERFQALYAGLLATVLAHRRFALGIGACVSIASLGLLFVVGTDFFPSVDAGLMKLHFRAPPGTRIETTERIIGDVEAKIHELIPAGEIDALNDMLGLPISYNLAFIQTDNVGPMDAEILIALKPGHHATAGYMRRIRAMITRDFPGSTAYFQPADIVSQVLNFGLASPIDVQVEFPDLVKAYEVARKLRDMIATVPGTADAHIVQVLDYPSLNIAVDRQRAAQVGVSERDVANNLLISLSSSGLVSPSYFLNPRNNVNYVVAVKSPLPQLASVGSVMATPLSPPGGAGPAPAATPTDGIPDAPTQTLSSVADIRPGVTPVEINHYTVQRVLDIGANVEGRDLGAVSSDIEAKIRALGPLPKAMKITVRGQNQVMESSFRSLGLGLILAALLVYCLMVVLFQSWLDPFIIMVAVPGALVGILWMLAATHTTLNVESLMGAIMAVGIAVSNSILLVSFANDLRVENEDISPLEAALEAGRTRLRPVLMTALAMVIGMIPMALGLGEAGEQNAPLGRAVIGGLLMATFVTLFMVPVVYAILRRKLPTKHLIDKKFLAEEHEGAPQATT
ncbi:MAG TPA: efflux RND transporter permease subunit [Polyangia bacterium]|jgi:multidrug efflux pump subunit AcrB|nr:efflux RND transporter permease subunit [Polyangia bacterium]